MMFFIPIEKQLGMIEEDPNTSPVVMDQFETYLIDEGFKVKKKDFTYFTQELITEELMKLYYDRVRKRSCCDQVHSQTIQ